MAENQNYYQLIKFKVLFIQLTFFCLFINIANASSIDKLRGQRLLIHEDIGDHYVYYPKGSKDPEHILFIIHGSINKGSTALIEARNYLHQWMKISDYKNIIVVAPVFDKDRYGWYRHLYGKNINADEFIHKLVEKYQKAIPSLKEKIFLFGHSAGGQFVSRYIVKNPERFEKAVISCTGLMAFPLEDTPWPFGMAYPANKPDWVKHWEHPDSGNWLQVATKDVMVVIGSKDLHIHDKFPGRVRKQTTVSLAREWVDSMNKLADKHGKEGKIKLHIVPNWGHGFNRTVPVAKKYFFGEDH